MKGHVSSVTFLRTLSTVTTHQHQNNKPHVVSAVLTGKTCGVVCSGRIKIIYIIGILIYIQQDATLHSLFYLETALHISGGTTTNHQERKQLLLQHLVFVRPLLLPAAIVACSSNVVMMGGGTTRNM